MFIPRLCSTVVLLTLFVCSVFIPGLPGKICFTVLAVGGAFLSVWEFAKMLENKGMKSYPVYIGCYMTAVVLWLLYFMDREAGPVVLFLLLIVFVMLCWIQLLCSRNRMEVLQKMIHSVGIFTMLSVPFIIVVIIYVLPHRNADSIQRVFFYFVIATKIGDIGAYVTGSLSNKFTKGRNHKLIPSISPGKSWEGFIGGLLISIVFSILVLPWALSESLLPVWISIVFGTVLFFGGAAGDLAESSLKRICQIKDSGRIIPGIGGVMDLIDSLLLNAPVFYFMFMIFVLYYRS